MKTLVLNILKWGAVLTFCFQISLPISASTFPESKNLRNILQKRKTIEIAPIDNTRIASCIKSNEYFGNDKKVNTNLQGYFFNRDNQKRQSIPFKLICNLIIIPVQINNSDTMLFILDTGVNKTIITQLPDNSPIQLNYLRKIKINGQGMGESLEAVISTSNTVSLKGITGYNQTICVLPPGEVDLSAKLGTAIHGIIGYDLLKDYIVEIDYRNRVLEFLDPAKYNFKRNAKYYCTLPLVFHTNKPYIQTNIKLQNNDVINVKLLVDTGASDALWLYLQSDSRLKLPTENCEAYLGKGLIGDIFGFRGRIAKLDLSNFELFNVIAAFPDTSSSRTLMMGEKTNGLLGAETLNRFFVILDYPNQRISLRPNNGFNKPFLYNKPGIDISNPIPGLPFYTISNIYKNSPAEKAGLRTNDRIISINNVKDVNYTFDAINNLLYEYEMKKMKIKVMREGNEFTAVLNLDKRL